MSLAFTIKCLFIVLYVHLQPERITNTAYHGDLFMFLIIPDMPLLVSSLALQAYDLFLSVVKLGKSPRLSWRTMSQADTPAISPTRPKQPSGIQLWPRALHPRLVPSGMCLWEAWGRFQIQWNRVTDLFFPFSAGLQESPKVWSTPQLSRHREETSVQLLSCFQSVLYLACSRVGGKEQGSQWRYHVTMV